MPVAITSQSPPSSSISNGTKQQQGLHSARNSSLLPPELWAVVLSQLPPSELQHTALALSRAIPNAGVTLEHLFSHVRITRDVQAQQLVRRLGPRFSDAAIAKKLAKSIDCLAWRTDSNLLVNLVTSFPSLSSLSLFAGILFAPEHLEELFDVEKPQLEKLALRFNPYVDKASYTIFLKGLYFDTGILRLARWPVTPSFRRLALVQDPIPSYRDLVAAAFEAGLSAPTKAHAQPIVFFKLSCLSTLAVSPPAAHISHLRLRIPGRSVMTPLSSASTSSTVLPPTHSAALPKPFPALEHLDISTTYVGIDAAFQGLLKRHPGLRHLVVDRSGLIRFGMPEHTCAEIGKTVASAGVSRATEAMKVFRAAWRAQVARAEVLRRAAQLAANGGGSVDAEHAQQVAVEQRMQAEIRQARRGRSAFATERRPRSAHVAPGGNAGNSELDEMNEALANLVVSDGSNSNAESTSSGPPVVAKPVILPSAPALLSLACGVGEHEGLDEDLRDEWEAEFQAGYEEGKERVISHIREKLDEYARLQTRARNASNTHKSSPEDRIPPTLVRFRTPAERKARQKQASSLGISVEDLDISLNGGRKDILGVLDLVPCEVADALELIDQVNESECVLCTVPDCAGQGRIATTDAGEADRKGEAAWRRPASEHEPGCGHLIGRRIWEEEGQDSHLD